jgi:hypothetical protein
MKVAIINRTASCINFRWNVTREDEIEIEMTLSNATGVQLASGARATLTALDSGVQVEFSAK